MSNLWRPIGCKASHLLASISIALLAACGANEASNSGIAGVDAGSNAINSVAISSANTPTDSGLLKSLAQLYPNGQLPTDRTGQAHKDKAKNPAPLLLTAGTDFVASTPHRLRSQNAKAAAVTADYKPVNRLQMPPATLYGAYFFTIYDFERDAALASNADWRLEGPAFWTSLAAGEGLQAVHRYRNLINGSYIYTIYDSERADIAANYVRVFTYEGVAWYARQTPDTGWSPLYRFRNKTNNTYLFTAYETEKDAIVAGYSAVFVLEGIAYYVRQNAPIDPPVAPPTPIPSVTAITPSTPTALTVGVATVYTVVGSNLPLTATLSIAGATCQAPTGNTAIGFSQICTLGGAAGAKTITVSSASGGTVLDASRSITARLPILLDTGITSSQCYGAGSNVLISCTDPVAIALSDQQDGMRGRDVTSPAAADGKLGFSYSEVPNPAGGTYARTECVQDNLTGLMWEGKPTTGLRAADNIYTNYDSTTALQKKDPAFIYFYVYVAPTQAEIDAPSNSVGFKNTVNTSGGICGYTDWRLPSADELQTLVDYGVASPGPTIDTTWFPNTFGAEGSMFLSSSPNLGSDYDSWAVYFDGGVVDVSPRDSYNPLHVRLVRGSTMSKQYTISADGQEVTDTTTGLIWQRCAQGMTYSGGTCTGEAIPYTQEAALALAKVQATATGVAWRVPNVRELSSILDRTKKEPAIDSTAFPATSTSNWYLSSSPVVGDSNIMFWGVDFAGGSVSYEFRENPSFLRLVRAGQ